MSDLDWTAPKIAKGIGNVLDLIGEGYKGADIAQAQYDLMQRGEKVTMQAVRDELGAPKGRTSE